MDAADWTVECEDDLDLESCRLVHSSTVLAYVTPAESTAWATASVHRPIVCESSLMGNVGGVDTTLGQSTALSSRNETAEITVHSELWCQPEDQLDSTGTQSMAGSTEFLTGSVCEQTLPQGSFIGWRFWTTVRDFLIVPLQCTLTAGTQVLRTVVDGRPTDAGMANTNIGASTAAGARASPFADKPLSSSLAGGNRHICETVFPSWHP